MYEQDKKYELSTAEILENQKKLFRAGKTKSVSERISSLRLLRDAVKSHEKEVLKSLYADLGKSEHESYLTEVGVLYNEISYMLKHVKEFSKAKRVRTPITHMMGRSYLIPEPYGNVLVISPWNYPFLLALHPAVEALAAGNTVVIKPSEFSPNTSSVLSAIVKDAFPEGQVAVIEGGREVGQELLQHKFDYIFFTGGTEMGKRVMAHAAQNLTPVTLELGGKSPCIVDPTADINAAAKRIVFGKYLNAGQTCVAPDYLMVHREVKDKLLLAVTGFIQQSYGREPLRDSNYGKIINKGHYQRLMKLLEGSTIIYGGRGDGDMRITPTIVRVEGREHPIMQEEIFGPILPMMVYDDIRDVINFIQEGAKPLALYLFTKDKSLRDRILREVSFGGGCVNDTIMHVASPHLGFGGVGDSGIGRYHGKSGFDTFTHMKSIYDKGDWPDVKMKYPPYTKQKTAILRKVLK